MTPITCTLTIGVLALQGAFIEHVKLLRLAAADLQPCSASSSSETITVSTQSSTSERDDVPAVHFDFIEVRTPSELKRCDALIIPGGESTSISLIAERTGLLEPLREFVKLERKAVWGTCAGLILLAEQANRSKTTGQELIGGLDVRVQRNYFGRQVESFEADMELPFLGHEEERFHAVFIRAPVVEKIFPVAPEVVNEHADEHVMAPPKQATTAQVEILARLPGRARALKDKTTTAEELGEDGDIVAVRQGNVFGTAFHPELTGDPRIHRWWLMEVLKTLGSRPTVHASEVNGTTSP